MIHRAGSSSFYSLIVSLLLIAFVLPPAPVQAANTLHAAPTEMAGDAFAPVTQPGQQTVARGVIAGEVFDAATGLPLADANVHLISPDGAPTALPATTSDARGRFRLVTAPGLVRIAVEKPGYSSAERSAQVVDRQRVAPFDARLTPLDANSALISAFGGGSVATSSGDAVLLIPPGGLIDDQVMQITAIGAQGLVGVPPAGWSPLAAVEISPISATFVQSATLSIAAPAGLSPDAAPTAARWNATHGAWIVTDPPVRTADGLRFQLSASAPGQIALFLADAVNGPPAPVLGAPLPGAADAGLPSDASAAISPSPQILVTAPGVTSDVQVQAGATTPLTSGTAMRLDLRESYRFINGAPLHPEPVSQDVRLYAYPGGQFASQAELTLSPSRIFAVHELEQGVIDLAVRPATSAAQGILLTSDGATVETPTGQRLGIPRNATLVDLPLLLTPLPQAEFPPIIPAELTFLDAVTVDFHGGRLTLPAVLSISAPPTLPASSQVLIAHLVEVQNVTYLSLVGPASRSADGRLQFSGLLDEGRYVFLAASQPLGFVTGTINNADGQSQAGMIATLNTFPLASISTPEGRYILAAPPGPVTVTVRNPLTSDVVTRPVTISGVGSFASLNIGLTPQPPSVVAISPANGAVDVPLISVVQVTFSEPVNPLTVLDALTVVDDNGAALAGSQSLTPEGTVLTFRPDAILADSATYSLTVSAAVQDLAGNPLTEVFRARFTTVDVTPPTLPPAGQISVTIPDATGFCTVSGTQGTVQPDWVVIVKNRTTNALTSVLPNADGSFSLNVAASPADKLDLILQDAAGNQVTTPLPRYRNPDGTVVVGSEGGPVDGPSGEVVDIPANALPPGTLVKVGSVAEGDLPQPAPPGYPFLGGVDLQMSNDASKPLVLSIPAPADATPDDVVLVLKHVVWPNGQGWMLVDEAFLVDGKYTTQPPAQTYGKPPGQAKMVLQVTTDTGMPGPTTSGQYAVVRSTSECTSYVRTVLNYASRVVAVFGAFVVLATSGEITNGYIPSACNTPAEIRVYDQDTNALLKTISQTAPPERRLIVTSTATDDNVKPRVVEHNLYNGYPIRQIQVRFSESMNAQSVINGLRVTANGIEVPGQAEMRENDTLLVFTPTISIQGEQGGPITQSVTLLFDTDYQVEINDATDASPNANPLVLEEPIRAQTFEPNVLQSPVDEIGVSPGAQAVASTDDTLFVASRSITDPIYSLAVMSTSNPTMSVKIDSDVTGLRRIRSMLTIPDVFVTLKPDSIEPDLLFSQTITETWAASITSALDQGVVTGTLKLIFDQFDWKLNADGEPKPEIHRIELSTLSEVKVKEVGREWFIEDDDRLYLVKFDEPDTLEVYTGRDLLVLVGSTSNTIGGVEFIKVFDVTQCTKRDLFFPDRTPAETWLDCQNLADQEIIRKALTDPNASLPPYSTLPRLPGVPTQLAGLHDATQDVVAVYVLNSGVGLQAIDIPTSVNFPGGYPSDPEPTGLKFGNYQDVTVLKNIILATEKPNGGSPQLSLLTPQLQPFVPEGGSDGVTLAFDNVFGVAAGANTVYDMDGDGRVGAAEDDDDDDVKAVDEVFDLALVTTGARADGTGALWVVDISAFTDLKDNRYARDAQARPRIVTGVPLPLGVRGVQFDPEQKRAYVDVDGEGIYIIDLDNLQLALKAMVGLSSTDAPPRAERNASETQQAVDGRVIAILPNVQSGNLGDVPYDFNPKRPFAHIVRYNSGAEILQIDNRCADLSASFSPKDTNIDQEKLPREQDDGPGVASPITEGAEDLTQKYRAEKAAMQTLLAGAALSLTNRITQPIEFYMLEQGSGSCFWDKNFDAGDPKTICSAFTPGASDHDIQVFVPATHIRRAQTILDVFTQDKPKNFPNEHRLVDDLSLYAMPKEAFEAGVLLNSPPTNKAGDTAGDLGMGRQTLLLLWLLTAKDYVPLDGTAYQNAPALDKLLECLRVNRTYDVQSQDCTGPTMYPGQPTGIPMLEGYEWAVLQEYNVYKTGAMLRIAGACDFTRSEEQKKAYIALPNTLDVEVPDNIERSFIDSEALIKNCDDQLHTVGKAAIRTVFARLIADPQGNQLVLGGRWSDYSAIGTPAASSKFITVTRDALLGNTKFCLTELGKAWDPQAPPQDPIKDFQPKNCNGFEEYVATMAIESVRRGLGIFTPEQLPLIWQFWCIKVGDACTYGNDEQRTKHRVILSDADAAQFVSEVISFIEDTQAATQAIYQTLRMSDTVTLGSIVQNRSMGAYPFLPEICTACAKVGVTLLLTNTRSDLRNCNLQSVTRKVNGNDAQSVQRALTYFKQPLLFPYKDLLKSLKSDLGVRNYAFFPLRVAVSNESPQLLRNVRVDIYEDAYGNLVDENNRLIFSELDQTEIYSHTIPYSPASSTTAVDAKTVEGAPTAPTTKAVASADASACQTISTSNPEYPEIEVPTPETKKENTPVFPAIFAISKTLTIANGDNGPRLIVFRISSDPKLPEPTTANNYTFLAYTALDRGANGAPLASFATPMLEPTTLDPFADYTPVVVETGSNALCPVNALLDVDLTLAAPSDAPAAPPDTPGQPAGADHLQVYVYNKVEQVFTLYNRSGQALSNVQVLLNGEEVFNDLQIGPHQTVEKRREYIPSEVKQENFIAVVTGEDEAQNSLAPSEDGAILVALRNKSAFEITLYDATELNQQAHPFSRYNVHHNLDTQANVPIVGAVTDGAARVQVHIKGLSDSEPAVASIVDADISDETDGIGQLQLVDSSDKVITSGVRITIETPTSLAANLTLYYIPPSGFVRDEHYLRDQFRYRDADVSVPRKERKVKFTIDQKETGYSTQLISLIRPPVFTFHGLGGDPTTWNYFHPIVPRSGVSPIRSVPVDGFDGRFMVFSAGTSGTVLPVWQEAQKNHEIFRSALSNPNLRGYAIAGVDIVANSMGGLMSRELARSFVKDYGLRAPIHKLITIGTPHLGSPVASQVVATRNQASLFDYAIDFLNLAPGDPRLNDPAIKAKQASVLCATAVQLVSNGDYYLPGSDKPIFRITLLDAASGAVVDLAEDSEMIQRLQKAGVLVPTHYVVVDANIVWNSELFPISYVGLAEDKSISFLWFMLGMFCNWTPDPTTVETTKILNAGVLAGGLGLKLATRFVSLLKYIPNLAPNLTILKNLTVGGDPESLLPRGNDRIVPLDSQLNHRTVSHPAVTYVYASTDHLDVKVNYLKIDQESAIAACYEHMNAAWASPSHRPRHMLNDKDLMPCQVAFLLETDGSTDLFEQPGQGGQTASFAPTGVSDVVDADQKPDTTKSMPFDPSAFASQSVASIPQVSTEVSLTILSPVSGAIFSPGQMVDVAFIAPSATLTSASVILGDSVVEIPQSTLSTLAGLTLTTQITAPLSNVGPISLDVVIQDQDGIMNIESVEVIMDPGVPNRLSVQGARRLISPGQIEQVRVYGEYPDGETRDLTLTETGTTYQSTNPDILAVSPTGIMQARKFGSATVRVLYTNPTGQRTVIGRLPVQVSISPADTNHIPVASAIVTPTVGSETIVTLSAAASSDEDDDPLTYQWRQTGGRLVYLDAPNTATPRFISPRIDQAAVLTFELTVRDDKGASSLPFPVQVTVTP